MENEPTPQQQPVVPPATPAALAEIPSTADERSMALLCHLGGALLGFLVPLIVWLVKKDQSRFVDDQGKEALNFQLTMLILHMIGGVTICLTFGAINLAVFVLDIVFGIMAATASNKGEVYRYPLCFRFIT